MEKDAFIRSLETKSLHLVYAEWCFCYLWNMLANRDVVEETQEIVDYSGMREKKRF